MNKDEQVAYEYHRELKEVFDDWHIDYGVIDREIKEANIGKSESSQ